MADEYKEPITVEQLVARSAIELEGPLADALKRIKELEEVLLPFAVQGTMISNASINLKAAGRDDPAGGTWLSTLSNINVQPAEQLFYNAVDVYGRKRTEEHMVALFEKMQQARAAMTERDKGLENGARTH